LLLVPFRDELANLRQLLPLLAQLNYPAQQVTAVLIDDGSTDESGCYCQEWIANRPGWYLVSFTWNRGKAAALRAALAQFPDGDFVAVFDADERPSPHTLTHMMAYFANGGVGAVNGRRALTNPLVSLTASYASFENLVYQWVTVPAKDRLRLAPPLLGSNCVYRREALTAVGSFKPGALLEDSDLTLKLARAGWHTRYAPPAISHHAAPAAISQYWRQRVRWSTGFQDVAQEQTAAVLAQKQLPFRLRLELLLFSLGYLDRVALVAALWGCWQRPFVLTKLNLFASLATPFLQMMAALKMSQSPLALWQRLVFVPFFYVIDIAATVASLWYKVRRQTILWEARETHD
jgi:cellulose synthase/poly-beta-1,6-N-acetylglucosamine synthase-like glycosyltransferase